MASSAELAGRRILVAGASGGIGLAVARRLAAAGARLVLVARSPAPLDAAARETGGTGVPGDVADGAFVDSLRSRVAEEGSLDGLVHAAGAFDLAPIASTSPDMFRRMVDGNLTGPFLLIRAFLPAMLEAGHGHIVTIGSVAGRVAFPGNGAYSASKFGVRGLHAVLDQELRGTGVRCTLVEPGATDTRIWDPLDPDGRDDLPSREAMLSGDAVADAVHFALTRPPDVMIPTLPVQRS
jgi:NAD(P)-dependent dehydrogenase (short-subunit alcohol dehydrogenase family)